MKKKLLIASALALIASGGIQGAEENHAHWSYSGTTDPRHWGELQQGFATCKIGKEQSPIDIRDAKKGDLPAIGFAYKPGPAEIVNNGHTIQVNPAAGGTLTLASGEYELVQLHFHAPGEERIKGKAYPLGAHLVHRDEEGKLAVVGILFKVGKENPVLARIFEAMPTQPGSKAVLPGDLNVADLLPASRGYYAFTGSLTTPPCSEGVRWQILRQPLELSKAQLAAFRKIYPMNARPVQPLNGRRVEKS